MSTVELLRRSERENRQRGDSYTKFTSILLNLTGDHIRRAAGPGHRGEQKEMTIRHGVASGWEHL
ncbi:hypothetical protein KGM_205701 [Danaus plexippus plexippus]|uniref:Uncharacterized protein n=1 Tax=Danaus plexippus plexippus TaxID=278856 RepID=A0A212FGH3_DANPL|nr:hypothetical protein KGM_205701 [Danaus plexippus plexippus]